MFLYRKQIFVILPFHFSWLNWVRKCCSISADFCIVYSRSTFRPSDHAYCQLYQFIMLTFHPFWQSHSMESNRSSSSINSYTFISNTLISLIEAIYYIISMPSVQSFQSVLYFLLQFHWNIPTVFFHFNDAINLISFHQFLQFHQFLSISFNSMSFIDSVNTTLSIPSIQFHLLHQIHQ